MEEILPRNQQIWPSLAGQSRPKGGFSRTPNPLRIQVISFLGYLVSLVLSGIDDLHKLMDREHITASIACFDAPTVAHYYFHSDPCKCGEEVGEDITCKLFSISIRKLRSRLEHIRIKSYQKIN